MFFQVEHTSEVWLPSSYQLFQCLLSAVIFFWASVNLMGLHIAGAIYHRLQGDGVWSAMVPILKEEPDK